MITKTLPKCILILILLIFLSLLVLLYFFKLVFKNQRLSLHSFLLLLFDMLALLHLNLFPNLITKSRSSGASKLGNRLITLVVVQNLINNILILLLLHLNIMPIYIVDILILNILGKPKLRLPRVTKLPRRRLNNIASFDKLL